MTQSARKKYRQSKKTVFLTRLFPLAVLLCLLLLLLWQSSMVGDRLRQTLSLCGRALVPSLFPFLILSELMLSLGLSEDAGRFVPAPVRRFLGLSEGGSAALLLGMLCGFPIVARILKRLYE